MRAISEYPENFSVNFDVHTPTVTADTFFCKITEYLQNRPKISPHRDLPRAFFIVKNQI